MPRKTYELEYLLSNNYYLFSVSCKCEDCNDSNFITLKNNHYPDRIFMYYLRSKHLYWF